jgi:hypothetical protein
VALARFEPSTSQNDIDLTTSLKKKGDKKERKREKQCLYRESNPDLSLYCLSYSVSLETIRFLKTDVDTCFAYL